MVEVLHISRHDGESTGLHSSEGDRPATVQAALHGEAKDRGPLREWNVYRFADVEGG